MSSQSLQRHLISRAEQFRAHKESDNSWSAGWVDYGGINCIAVGSLSAAQDTGQLRLHGITHVLTVASRLQVWEDRNRPSFLKDYLQVDILDHPEENLFAVIPPCMQFLQKALGSSYSRTEDLIASTSSTDSDCQQNKVLIHCASGISRSVSIAAVFLMMGGRSMNGRETGTGTRLKGTEGMGIGVSYREALRMIRFGRPHASPNVGFQYQLQCLDLTAPHYDLEEASTRYQRLTQGTSITDLINRQRSESNAKFTQLDMIKRKGEAAKSDPRNREGISEASIVLSEVQEWLRRNEKELETLQKYSQSPDEDVLLIVDRPSLSIRRAAVAEAKVYASHLLQQIKFASTPQPNDNL